MHDNSLAYNPNSPSFLGRNYKARVMEFQSAERDVEIKLLQHAIQRERAKAERHESNLLSAQALAKMLQVGL